MKNLRRRAVAISVGRRCRPFQFRGGDASLYTLHELDEEEHPVDDDEYEYYEVDHVESAEEDKGDDDSIDYDNNSDKRLISLSKQRNVGMSPLSMRAISSKLSALHQRLGIHHNHNVAFLSLEPFTKFLSLSPHFESSSSSTAAAMVVVGITASLSLWILRTMILHKSWRKLDILHKKRNTHEDDESAKKEKTKHGDKKLMKKKKNKYGDYSTGYPAEGNDDVVDLDEASRETMERYSVRNAWMTTALAPFHLVADWMDGVTFRLTAIAGKIGWLSSIGNALLLFSKTKKRLGPAKTETHTIGKDDAEFMSMTDNEEAPSNQATTEEENNAARILRQQLDTLAEAHESLEQEYEASLRMLHEARMELRRLKSKRSNYNNDDDDDDRDTTKNQQQQQQQIMQDNIQKLEQKYKQQMKEQMERYRNQTEQKLREELAREYESALQSQSEQMAQELQRQKQDYLASPSFRQLVDEASSVQIQEAVAQAVRDTMREQQARAREEMMRVREGIQQVLDRERRMMKEQVAKATSQVREWVKRRQVEQWQRREEQLVVEARELGLLEEEGVGEEEGKTIGDGFSSTRDREGGYAAGSSTQDERRRWDARDGSVGPEEDEETTTRGDDYPDRSNEYYYEEKDENGEDDGTVGDMGQEVSDPRAQQPRRGQPRYSSSSHRNVYREAAKRKQRRREEGL